jgi:hypothetical protein
MVDQGILQKAFLPIDDKHQIEINHFRPYENSTIFNEEPYFRLHSTSQEDIFAQLVCIPSRKVRATVIFYADKNFSFVSPNRGTFGGVTLSEPIEMPLLERFIFTTKGYLIKMGAQSISIKCAPFRHNLALSSVMTNILLRHEFRISGHELNYEIHVDDRLFTDRVDYGNEKRIRKCQKAGFFASQVDSADYRKVYQLIKKNRERREFPITMSLEQVGKMVEIFPERMRFFAVHRDVEKSDMVAAAVCIAITKSILYVLYWGDVADVESYSPVALLADGIYGHCQQRGIKWLDVGTSTVDGEPNHGLIRFKRNLGFSESMKLSFIWEN